MLTGSAPYKASHKEILAEPKIGVPPWFSYFLGDLLRVSDPLPRAFRLAHAFRLARLGPSLQISQAQWLDSNTARLQTESRRGFYQDPPAFGLLLFDLLKSALLLISSCESVSPPDMPSAFRTRSTGSGSSVWSKTFC